MDAPHLPRGKRPIGCAAVFVLLTLSCFPAFAADKTLACLHVVEALDRLRILVPTLRGDADAIYPPPYLVNVVAEADAGSRGAKAFDWSAESVAALDALVKDSRMFMKGDLQPGAATLNQFLANGYIVQAESKTICTRYIRPLPKPAETTETEP